MKALSIWLLTQLQGSPSSTRILEAGKKRGHTMQLVNPLQLHFALDGSREVFTAHGKLGLPDIALTRMGSAMPDAGLHVLRQLEIAKCKFFNTWLALHYSRNKITAHQTLFKAGIPMPKSLVIGGGDQLEDVIELIPGPPWIVKLPRGTKGTGVMRVDSLLSLISCLESLRSLGATPLLQEFIKLEKPNDIRVFVLGGKALAAMRRTAKSGDFRSNLDRGGHGESVEISQPLAEIALRAAAAFGLEIAGVDILETAGGYQVIEVNGSPGLAGIEGATKIPLAEMIIDHLEQRAK